MDYGNSRNAFDFERSDTVDIDVAIKSPAIRRLIEEVRAEAFEVPRSYNRTFNRHNR